MTTLQPSTVLRPTRTGDPLARSVRATVRAGATGGRPRTVLANTKTFSASSAFQLDRSAGAASPTIPADIDGLTPHYGASTHVLQLRFRRNAELLDGSAPLEAPFPRRDLEYAVVGVQWR